VTAARWKAGPSAGPADTPAKLPRPAPASGPAPSVVLPILLFCLLCAAACDPPAGTFRAEYYPNPGLEPPAARVLDEPSIDHAWGLDGPGGGVGNDAFSVRWTGTFVLPEDDYLFVAEMDDGMRAEVDGDALLDRWDGPPGKVLAGRFLDAGEHALRVEHVEGEGEALARFWWRSASTLGVRTTFWHGPQFEREAAVREDEVVDSDWGTDPPHPDVGVAPYSARFQAYLTVPRGGEYRLLTEADDGVVLFLDGRMLLYDFCAYCGNQHRTGPVSLEAFTPYPLELLYHNVGLEGRVHLLLEAPDAEAEPVPLELFSLPDAFFPAVDLAHLAFTEHDPQGNLLLYEDGLGSNWHDWSWGCAAEPAYAGAAHAGTCSIAADIPDGAAFSPFFSNGQDWNAPEYGGLSTRPFESLGFWVHRGQSAGGQTLCVEMADILPGWDWRGASCFTVPGDDAWRQVVIPLSELSSVDTRISRLQFRCPGGTGGAVLLDDIRLLAAREPAAVERDPVSCGEGVCWLYRDERNAQLGTSLQADIRPQSPVRSHGAFGLAARFQPYGYLEFRPLGFDWTRPAPFALSSETLLRFDVNRGANDRPDQGYGVYARDGQGNVTGRVSLADYVDGRALDLDPGTWQTASVPLWHLTPDGGSIHAVGVQETSGTPGGTADALTLDEVRFEAGDPPPPAVVYDDVLRQGWTAASEDTQADFAHAATVHGGTASLEVAWTSAAGELRLDAAEPLRSVDVSSVGFWVHGGETGGQAVGVRLVDGGGREGATVLLAPAAGTWQRVVLSLGAFGPLPDIAGLILENAGDGPAAPVYLDDIVFGNETPLALPPVPGPSLTVDAQTGRAPISPYIYGMNHAGEALAAELGLPLRRFGGNPTSRYNWRTDAWNVGRDWFFENAALENPDPGSLPDGSSADRFVERNRATGTASLLTLPLVGYVARDRERECGFRVSRYGAQQYADPWQPDCGNGVLPDGSAPVTGNDPLDTSVAVGTDHARDWVLHLTGRYGAAGAGGVAFYGLDNEPMLWDITHRDVRPAPLGYDELLSLTVAYASAVKGADPGARILGPVVWGWTAYFWSGLDRQDAEINGWEHTADREAHGGVPLVEWYLASLKAREDRTGVRLLDYLDLHYYPQAAGVAGADAGDPAARDLRLRSTRSLWDPSYVDESWIREPVRLIPRMRDWVNARYPGTGLAVTEYSWGAFGHVNGALAQAEVLGIFGREGLDLAALWGEPGAADPVAFAFRMYRNYDGQGSAFGDTSVSAGSGGGGELSVFAALRSADGALTVMVINKTSRALSSTVNLSGFLPAAAMRVFRYGAGDPSRIVREPDQPVSPAGFTAAFPAESITLLEIARADGAGVGAPSPAAAP